MEDEKFTVIDERPCPVCGGKHGPQIHFTEPQPSYYTIIPASIRYDKELSEFEKLLYGEIVALTNKEGYCWAENKYFAGLYKKSITHISNSIKRLACLGHIIVKINKEAGNTRRIYITEAIKGNLKTYLKKFKEGSLKKFKDTNNTSINNKINSNEKFKQCGSNPLYREWCMSGSKLSFEEYVKRY